MDTIPCPKCSSRSTQISTSRSPFMGVGADKIFHCRTCGTRIYGPEKVNALVAAHESIVQAARMREEKSQAEEKRWIAMQVAAERVRQEEEGRAAKAAADAERRRERRRVETERILAAAKCGWPPCKNDHTMTSRYCSKLCRDRVSKAKQKSASPAKPVSPETVAVVPAPTPLPEVTKREETCALTTCSNPPAVNSKYCGRSCRIKYAHLREKDRKLVQAVSCASSARAVSSF